VGAVDRHPPHLLGNVESGHPLLRRRPLHRGGARLRAGSGTAAERPATVAEPRRHAVLGAGEREKSRAAYEKAVELGEADRKVNPRQPQLLAQLADGYAMLGRRPEALAAAAAVERQGEVDGDVAFMLGSVYEHLGDRTAAFAWLRRAIEGKYPVETIARSPFLAELRKDARYSTLVNPSVNP
jgi:tetratricopeptide (TPR) repeat protein